MSKLAKRVLTGASLVLLVVVLLQLHLRFPGGVVVWSAATALSLLGALEVARMPGLAAPRLGVALVLAVAVVATLTWWEPGARVGAIGAGAATALALGFLIPATSRTRSSLLVLWCAVPLFGLLAIDARYGLAGLAVLVLLSKVGDVFGYFVGRAIGVRHPFPNLSPGKTVAGCVASLVAGVVAGALLGVFDALPVEGVGVVRGAIAGLLLNLAAQAGDLLESRVKRLGGVKDSSGLVGPAGGVLDVVDSLLLTVPVALLTWPACFGTAS